MENSLYWKRDYLVKTLSRTRRKDYENYVVNAIWNRLQCKYPLEIQPVTQQCVRLKDGSHVLIDLFFPQVAIGIECDEAYHQNNHLHDMKRTDKIEEILSAYHPNSDFRLLRIDVSQSIEKIENEINKAAAMILAAYEKNPQPWRSYSDQWEKIRAEKRLTINNPFRYRTIVDICNCIGHSCKIMQRSYFSIGTKYQLWCPKLAIQRGDEKVAASTRGWINILSEDWTQIIESNPKREDISVVKNVDKNRIVFAKSKDPIGQDGYRFVGVFRIWKSSAKQNIYEKVADQIDFTDITASGV